MRALSRDLLNLVKEASKVVLEVYEREFHVDYKSPGDPVTEADRLANALLCERITQLLPGVPVVAEESPVDTFGAYRTAPRVAFVDPVDGTRDFVRRTGQFVVMVGLVEDGAARMGVVASPTRALAWVGIVGEGAWEVCGDSWQPIGVSATSKLPDAAVLSSGTHRGRAAQSALDALGAARLWPMGSAGLKGVTVATGAADAYVSPHGAGMRWDACAVDALVTAAGGRVTDAHGVAFDYRSDSLVNDRGLVASNGRLHESILNALAAARRVSPDNPTT
jgi:3'(2'), 5'-bisphosphate nucleotidase